MANYIAATGGIFEHSTPTDTTGRLVGVDGQGARRKADSVAVFPIAS